MKFDISNYTISQKITGLILVYFVVAFVAIGFTFYASWQLDGGAAAINDAGSQRMRIYKIAFLLSQYSEKSSPALGRDINNTIDEFETTLDALEYGLPERPLHLPDEPSIRAKLSDIKLQWYSEKRPYIEEIINAPGETLRQKLFSQYGQELKSYVDSVNALVGMIESAQAQTAQRLRYFQIGLVSLALLGTILLIVVFMKIVIRPVRNIQKGLSSMGAGDFSTRLPVTSHDELGMLTDGFNNMAEQLQELYSTLEQRVISKTQDIELRSRELSALYETAAFLSSANATETLCDGVLGRMVVLFGAQGGVIRLVEPKGKGVPIVAWYGVSEVFLENERQLSCGECICGETVTNASAINQCIPPDIMTHHPKNVCQSEGFESILSVPIKIRRRVIGVFNLFFREETILPKSEINLLETVSQHLGAAIESQRLIDREKEVAVFEERNLLAQELHDSIAQSLAFLNIQVQLLQQEHTKGDRAQIDNILLLIKEGIQESYDDVRELLVHFRTRLEHDDIDVAIRSSLEKFEGQTGIQVHYQPEGHGVALQPEKILQILHILHECLSNIRKHANATSVNVKFVYGQECQLIIDDDGTGFDLHLDMDDTHVGLRIMRERASKISGNLAIDSAVSEGTTICLTFPLIGNV